MGEAGQEPEWTYSLEIIGDPKRRATVKKETVTEAGKKILDRPDANDKHDPERLTQTHLEQVSANKDFRKIPEYLNSVRYLHIVPQLIREPDRSTGKKNDPYGGDFLERLASTERTQKRTWESRLRRITEALQVAVPQLKDLRLERDDRGTPHIHGLYEHWRPKAGWQGEDQFSNGTLRLLGLLWSILEGSGPILLEEPELSLHPEIIRHIPQMFARLTRKKGRQVIVSTHSPELLHDKGIAPDEVLLLEPTDNGTEVRVARDDREVIALLEGGGATLADIVLPKTSPRRTETLALFPDLDGRLRQRGR